MKQLVLSFFLLSGFCYSQEFQRVFGDTVNTSPILQITSFNHYASNRFDNNYMDKFLFGGSIDQSLKDRNFNRLKAVNVIGAEAEQRIDSYTPSIHPLGRERYGMMLSFSDNHLAAATLPKDLYGLAMYGNSMYSGNTANLSFGHAQYVHFQKFSAGFYDTKSMSSIQLSFVSGSKAFDFYTLESFLYTHAAGDSVELKSQGEGFATERFYPYWGFQGSGFSVDINYNFIFYSKKGDNRQIVNFKISNAGAIFWNKNSTHYAIDSTVYFNGFNANSFLNDQSETYNFEDTLGLLTSKRLYGQALPLELSIEKLSDAQGKKIQPIYGFKAILIQDYRPYLYGGIYYRPLDILSMNAYLSYGGFSMFRLGYYAHLNLKEKASISIGTADLIGIISKNYGFGRSACLSAFIKL